MKSNLKTTIKVLWHRKNIKKYVDNYLLRSEDHEVYLGKNNKLALNSIDDKRKYINKIESVLWEKQNK